MRNGNERKSSSSSSSPLDCDVGLGLKMQLLPTESYTCDGGGSGGPYFSTTSNNHMECVGDIYHTSHAMVLPRSFHNTTAFRSSGCMSGKSLFTASQWQELERQNMINKYIMASIPVPPQLLLPTSSLSQYNNSGLELRFPSSGSSDPEPWRCKRTDGKKWRCSRDVAPDQKYCERHAHKSKPRSRKHVEISSHNNTINNNNNTPTTNYSLTNALQSLQRSSSHLPTMASNDQSRCIEWFMRGGRSSNTIPVTTCNKQQQQWQQVVDKDNTNLNHNKNVSAYQPQHEAFMSLNPYIPDTSNLENHSKIESLQSNSHGTQITRHFIDAWGKDNIRFDEISNTSKGLYSSLSKKFSPSSSLTLSMNNESDENGYLGSGMMMNSDSDSDGIMKSQWLLNPVCWMNSSSSSSPPGGPLGEALCLGNASVTRGSTNLASPHGYSNNSNNTNSSGCSKSSCEDGSQALNFIG